MALLAVFAGGAIAFQSCGPIQFNSRSSSFSLQEGISGGNGNPFDGMTSKATYYRIIPNLSCGGQTQIFGTLTISDTGMVASTLNPADCSQSQVSVSANDISVVAYDNNLVGLAGAVYEKMLAAPDPADPTLQVTEVLCRRTAANAAADAQGMDIVIRSASDSTTLTANVHLGQKDASGQTLSTQGPSSAVSRQLTGQTVTYFSQAGDILLNVSLNLVSGAPLPITQGHLVAQTSGLTIDESLDCRLGAGLDLQISPSTGEPQAPPLPPAQVLFADSFESGDFSGWSQAVGQNTTYGPGPAYVNVSTASSFGILELSGLFVGSFDVPPSTPVSQEDGSLIKEWSNTGRLDQFSRVESSLPNGGSPTASYRAWYYFAPTFQVSTTSFANIFYFGERGILSGNPTEQFVESWFLNIAPANQVGGTGINTVLFANHWAQNYSTFTPVTVPLPLGRWFELRADLYENVQIEWYLDGQLFDTSLEANYHVGRNPSFSPSNGWDWGVGFGSNETGGSGQDWISDCQVLTLP